jgi:hypothetical protein
MLSGASQASSESVDAACDLTVSQPLFSVCEGFFFRRTLSALTQ